MCAVLVAVAEKRQGVKPLARDFLFSLLKYFSNEQCKNSYPSKQCKESVFCIEIPVLNNSFNVLQIKSVIKSAMLYWMPILNRIQMPKLLVVSCLLHCFQSLFFYC